MARVRVVAMCRVMRMIVVVVRCAMTVAMAMAACGVGAVLGFKGLFYLMHDKVHGAQHVGQHMVGFNLQVVGLELDRHMAVAQVVGGADQVIRCAMSLAVSNAQHLLGRGRDTYQ
jgi:hypothetical protein